MEFGDELGENNENDGELYGGEEEGFDWHAVDEEEDDDYIGTNPANPAPPVPQAPPQAPPQIHSNRLNAQAFRRAVWRNGQIVSRNVGERRSGDTFMFEGDSGGGDVEGGEGNARTRTGLNLTQIELMATKATVEDHEELLSDASDDDNGDDGDDGDDGESGDESGSSSCGDLPDHCGESLRPQKRQTTSHSGGTAQNTMSLGLMNTLFGGTLESQCPNRSTDKQFNPFDEETRDDMNRVDTDTHSEAGSSRHTIPTVEEPCIELEHGTCVGCELGGLVEPVDKFVIDNAHRVPSNRLWSLAHDAYKTQVVDATRMQGGGMLPDWSRVDIQRHYEFHVVDERLFRLSALRDLQGLRALCKSRILTQTSDGTQEIDSQSMKEYMSIVSMESKEHHLLSSIVANSGGFGPSSSANLVATTRKRGSRR
jgi:hypothetical protein